VVIGVYVLVAIGLGLMAPLEGFTTAASAAILLFLATWALIAITRARTRGGWRWRWGGED
jgi:L-asparagine transporter-like permease